MEEQDSKNDSQDLLDIGGDSHSQGTGLLVCSEGHYIKAESNRTVKDQLDHHSRVHRNGPVLSEPRDLSGEVRVDDALQEGERRHAEEQFKRRQL